MAEQLTRGSMEPDIRFIERVKDWSMVSAVSGSSVPLTMEVRANANVRNFVKVRNGSRVPVMITSRTLKLVSRVQLENTVRLKRLNALAPTDKVVKNVKNDID